MRKLGVFRLEGFDCVRSAFVRLDGCRHRWASGGLVTSRSPSSLRGVQVEPQQHPFRIGFRIGWVPDETPRDGGCFLANMGGAVICSSMASCGCSDTSMTSRL